ATPTSPARKALASAEGQRSSCCEPSSRRSEILSPAASTAAGQASFGPLGEVPTTISNANATARSSAQNRLQRNGPFATAFHSHIVTAASAAATASEIIWAVRVPGGGSASASTYPSRSLSCASFSFAA